MSRRRITGLAVAMLALAACSSQEREKKQQEAAAAEKKLADTRAFHEGLEREKALLSKQLTEANAQADAALTAYNRTLAAAAYLAEQDGSGLKLDDAMRAARSGFQLEEAARKKDTGAITELASGLLESERPCVETKKEDSEESAAAEGESCGPCEVAPYEDACVGIPERLTEWPDWTCDAVTRSGEKQPPAVFCRATFEHLEPGQGEPSPYAKDDLSTDVAVVRIAFEHEGHLYASDWPEPAADLYHPRNSTGRAQCAATTQQNSCVHQCDVQFNRYEDPCVCQSEHNPYEYEGGEEVENDESAAGSEPYEVRQAREAAARAEAEAEEARKRAEEAAQEVSYRECLAACEPEVPEPPPTKDEDGNPLPPPAVHVKQAARLEASPAPGVFVVAVETRKLSAEGKELEVSTSSLVLEHSGLKALWMGGELPDADKLGALEQSFAFDEVLRQGDKVSLEPLPGMKGPMLVGLSSGSLTALRFSTTKGEEPVEVVEPWAVCPAMKAQPKRFPASFLEACANVPEGKVAGEVTP
jgi:hypothetical protein